MNVRITRLLVPALVLASAALLPWNASAAAKKKPARAAADAVAPAPTPDSRSPVLGWFGPMGNEWVFRDEATNREHRVLKAPPELQQEYKRVTTGKLPGQKAYARVRGQITQAGIEVEAVESVTLARPAQIASEAHVDRGDKPYGSVITTLNGTPTLISDAGQQAWVMLNGKAVLFSAPGTGGYENEGQRLMKYDLSCSCKPKPVTTEAQRIENVREVPDRNGSPVWVMELKDGGAGIWNVAIIDPVRNQVVYRKPAARVVGAGNGEITLATYAPGESAWQQIAAGRQVQPAATETLDLARVRKGTVVARP